MNEIFIYNSYKIWSWKMMKSILMNYTQDPRSDLGRSYTGMIIEWYIHNIGYYLTLPFPGMWKINERFKHVNLESHKKEA